MDAIDYKEALTTFGFVAEENQFYNRITKRPIKEKSVRRRIEDMYKKLELSGGTVDLIISEIKNWKIELEDLKAEKPNKKQIRGSAYSEVEEFIPMVWRASVKGESMLYHVNADREVTFCGGVTFENFSNVIRGSAEHLRLLRAAFENSGASEQLQKSSRVSRFEDYLRVLYQEFQYDPRKQLLEEPPIITHDSQEYAYKRFDPGKLQPGPTPTWDEFLSRLDYPEIFLAWIWSIFEPRNKGRQILWLQGQGNDGKSTAIQTITEYLGEDHAMPIQENVGSQFFYSNLYGKRLATFGDCKSPRYIANSKIHSLVGGDHVSIERKGENPFSAHVRVKMLIASNLFPQIDFSMPNEYTRLLLIKVSPQGSMDGDIYFKDKLAEEKWAFLARCKAMYEKHCPKDAQIHVSDEHFESMKIDAGSEESDYVTQFIDKFLIIEEEAKIRVADMRQRFDELARMAGFSDTKLARMKRDLVSQLQSLGVQKAKARFGSGKDAKVEHAYQGVKFKEGML